MVTAQLEAPQPNEAAPEVSTLAKMEPASGHSSEQASDPGPEYAHLGNIPLQLEAVLGRLTMNMRAVASLEVGSVLTLNRSAGDNVDLIVAGVNLASGEIVVIEDALGVRVTDLLAGE
jgi:flagellar motor switch protein FliN/FliY